MEEKKCPYHFSEAAQRAIQSEKEKAHDEVITMMIREDPVVLTQSLLKHKR